MTIEVINRKIKKSKPLGKKDNSLGKCNSLKKDKMEKSQHNMGISIIEKEIPNEECSLESTIDHHEGSFLDKSITFETLAHKTLNQYIIQALKQKLGYIYPTHIQSKVIPVLLNGKDTIIRAQTGSGKTLAYLIPILNKLIESNESHHDFFNEMRTLIFVPTRDLCRQVSSVLHSLCVYCQSFISIEDTAENLIRLAPKPLPTILVTTPKAFRMYISSHCDHLKKSATLILKSLTNIVIDEADTVIELGFQTDLDYIFSEMILPAINLTNNKIQIVVCSATFNYQEDSFNFFKLYKPSIIDLIDPNQVDLSNTTCLEAHTSIPNNIHQYYFNCPQNDKYLVLYGLLKLSLLPLKCLIFVESSKRAYGLSHFLECFSIRSSVITSEVSFVSRQTFLHSFNQGIIQILIATDQVFNEIPSKVQEPTPLTLKPSKGKRKRRNDDLYGVQRGLDFKNVASVVNFDCPNNIKSYIHRIGRTARGGESGVALTLVATNIEKECLLLQSLLGTKELNQSLKVLQLDIKDINCFRYRVQDILQSITPKKIASLQSYDIQRQFFKLQEFKEYFESNPEDVHALETAFQSLQRAQTPHQKHLKEMPIYFNASLKRPNITITPIQEAIQRLDQLIINTPTRLNKINSLLRKKFRKRSTEELLKKQLSKKPIYELTAPENLPALSGSKLYKMQHKSRRKLSKIKRTNLKKKRISIKRKTH